MKTNWWVGFGGYDYPNHNSVFHDGEKYIHSYTLQTSYFPLMATILIDWVLFPFYGCKRLYFVGLKYVLLNSKQQDWNFPNN